MADNMDIFHRSIRKHQPAFTIKVNLFSNRSLQRFHQVGPILRAHGAEVLVAGAGGDVREGDPPDQTVVLRFASKEAAQGWYDSPEYQAVVHLRTDNSRGTLVICDEFVRPG